MDIYVFGDQRVDCRTFLQDVLLCRESVLLTSFLDHVSVVLREEVSSMTHLRWGLDFPEFGHVRELVERYYKKGRSNPAIESAIVCLSQLAHFIRFSEEHSTGYFPAPSSSPHPCLLGMCTGLIAATAIASANSLTGLLPLAIEAVRVAFRVGAHVATVSDRLEERSDAQASWSTSLAMANQKSAEVALEKFHADNNNSHSNRVWVSAVSPMSVTISGPPSVRNRLLETSNYFQKLQKVNIQIFGAYHAPHLYTVEEIGKILIPQTRDVFGRSALRFPVLSSLNGKEIFASTPLALLHACLEEILRKPVRWDKVLGELTSNIAPTEAGCHIYPVGPTDLPNSIAAALNTAGHAATVMGEHGTWTFQKPTNPLSGGKTGGSKIAIVGMAGRFPDAADHEQFWNLLEMGLDVHRKVPKDRFDVELHTDPASKRKNTSHTPYGCFIENPGLFDARFFNMSPREAAQTDPMQRLMLTTAYAAMEMAGIVPGRTPSTMPNRIGTIYGQASDDWREINAAQDIDTYFISGGVRAFGPGRVNYFFKFGGPSFAIDTACSSSLAAIQLACTSLRAGECDTVFAGGANVLTNPDIFSGLSRGHFLSKTGSCKTFDNDADGYCRGDGVATVILKRLEDALADKDPILGIIRASATNHSAEAISITHPHAGAQEFLFSKMLQEAGVDPHDVSYVEMHGTGTQAGDLVEMESVSNVFAPTYRRRRQNQPLYLGAVKANVGHGEAASGVTSLIKTLLMLQNNSIPPHCGIKGIINENYPKDLQKRNVHIASTTIPFLRPQGGSRIIFLNNFSAAGGNTALLLEDGPEKTRTENRDPRSTHIVAVSAKSLASFRKTIRRLRESVDQISDVDLPSLSYTSTARRLHYSYRAALAVTSLRQVSTALTIMESRPHDPISTVPPQVAFVFTGQGSQYPALGKRLFETSRLFRLEIEELNQISQRQGFPSFVSLVDGSVEDIQTLSPIAIQLGMTCIQMALLRLWASWGIKASVVIGHSLGEYAALHAAGVLSVTDTIFLVGTRAMQLVTRCTVGTHAMLAVKAPESSIKGVISEQKIEVACINGTSETVLSGSMLEIDLAASKLASYGFSYTKLNVPFAFHSSQVSPILESFQELAHGISFHSPRIPVISPLLRKVVRDAHTFSPAYLSRHCRETVDFLGGLKTAIGEGVIDKKTIWVEIGAHPVCSNILKSTVSTSALTVPSLHKGEDNWKTIANSMSLLYSAGVPLDWAAYHREFEAALVSLSLPSYSFDEKFYWIDYTNNWCLTKGDSTSAPVIAQPRLSTTSIQKIVREEVQENTATVVAESDLAQPLLHTVVSGHLVNGAGLCPSSVYADMALTIASYTYRLLRPPAELVDMNVCNMENPAPLLLKNILKPEHQLVQVEATVDLITRQAAVTIRSSASDDKAEKVHGKCTVKFEDANQWVSEWKRRAFLIQTRIDMLEEKMARGDAHRILRDVAYKLFSSLVQYSDQFRGIKEVTLDSVNLEATSRVVFQAGPKDGNFFLSPYFIDSVAHLSGLVMNANDAIDSKNQVYISHGWESMGFAKTLEADKKYRSYVKMDHVAEKVVAGDVYIFDDEQEIIGVVGGLKFQCIPRTLLNHLLPPVDAGGTQRPARHNPRAEVVVETSKHIPDLEKKAKESEPSMAGIIAKSLNIVAVEIGVDLSELADAVRFSDLGVDSLMSLTISGRFREELGLDIHSTLFTDFPSIGHLKAFLSQHEVDATPDTSTDDPNSGESEGPVPHGLTPDLLTSEETGISSYVSTPSEQDEHQDIISIRSIFGDRMAITSEEVTETTKPCTPEIDSVMSPKVLDPNPEEKSLAFKLTLEEDVKPSLGMKTNHAPQISQELLKASERLQSFAAGNVRTISMLLQGNPRTATRKLFFFPDGSGSATSYTSIPPIWSEQLCVYGLNCPFMKDPASYTCGVEGVSRMYLEEVLRRQPQGPYLLGGWSAGGVIAFEVSRQLAALSKSHPEKNYKVDRLILIDSPCPIRLEPLPFRLHHFFNAIGLLGTGNPSEVPDWLLPHFEASITNLSAYQPEVVEVDSDAPKALLIWARDGVCKNADDPRPPPQKDDPESMRWLLENRTDFGPNGWHQLLGAENGACVSLPGNHFTMMKEPVARELAELIRRELEG